MRRSAVSVASNIAEGKGHSSDCEFVLFLCHARGSRLEIETQALIARKLGYVQETRIEELTVEVGKMLNGLINALSKQKGSLPERLKTDDR